MPPHQPRTGARGESAPHRVRDHEHRALCEFAPSGEDILSTNETDLSFASIEEIGKLFHRRKLSPLELTKLMLARVEQLNPKLNAYITITAELALAQAKKAESELFAPRSRKSYRDRGPLHGVPISLKDNIYPEGIPTTARS